MHLFVVLVGINVSVTALVVKWLLKLKSRALNGTRAQSYGMWHGIRNFVFQWQPFTMIQCYLQPNTSEHTPPSPWPDRPVLNLPTPEGWKAELN